MKPRIAPLFVSLSLLALSGPAFAADAAGTSDLWNADGTHNSCFTPAHRARMAPYDVRLSHLPRGAQLEPECHALGAGIAGWRVVNRPNLWAAGYTWFAFDRVPTQGFLSINRLFSMADSGLASRDVGLHTFRWVVPIEAASFEEASRRAVEQAPDSMPAELKTRAAANMRRAKLDLDRWTGTAPDGPGCWPPFLESEQLRGRRVDSKIVMLELGASARRFAETTDQWALEVTWFGVSGLPDRLYLMRELDALDQAGLMNANTQTELYTCRYEVRARSIGEVKQAYEARVAAGPGEALLARWVEVSARRAAVAASKP